MDPVQIEVPAAEPDYLRGLMTAESDVVRGFLLYFAVANPTAVRGLLVQAASCLDERGLKAVLNLMLEQRLSALDINRMIERFQVWHKHKEDRLM